MIEGFLLCRQAAEGRPCSGQWPMPRHRPGWTPSITARRERDDPAQLRAISTLGLGLREVRRVWGSQGGGLQPPEDPLQGTGRQPEFFTGGADGQTDVWTSTAGGGQMARMTVVPASPESRVSSLPNCQGEEAAPHPQPTWTPLPSPAREWVPNPLDGVLLLAVFLLSPLPSSGPCDGGLDSFSGAMSGHRRTFNHGVPNPLGFSLLYVLAMLSLHCGAQTLVAKHGL